ncbi:MAG: GDP-mannose 4,6-dehydratase [Actinomycetota bacterium]
MNERRTLLLIGAGGFAGAHLRQAAEAAGMRVVGGSRSPAGTEVACDLLQPASIAAAIDDVRPQVVVNLAGAASVAESWREPGAAFAVNATGALNLLEALAASAFDAQLICASSAEVYGQAGPERMPLREDEPLRPVSPYGSSKAAMEVVCGQYVRSHGMRIAVVRSFNQLGPGQPAAFVASALARQVAAAEVRGSDAVTLAVGNLSAARDFTDVRDGARAYREIAAGGATGTYNLCSGKPVRISSLIEMMREATPLEVDTSPDPELTRPVDPPVVYGSAQRLREATGWEPEIPLQRTVAELLEWWRAELRGEREGAAA